MVHTSTCVHQDRKQAGSLESTKDALQTSQVSVKIMVDHELINNWFIHQRVFIKIGSRQEVWRAQKMLSKLPKCFIYWWTHSWLWTNCFITFSTWWRIFFSRDLFADVMSMHNRNIKQARAIEFDQTNLLAML